MPAFSSEDAQDRTLIEPGSTIPVPLPDASPFLVVLYPTELHRRMPLERGRPLSIGRSLGCDLQISDDLVSRRHCEVLWDGRRVSVRDLGSTNGTWVDGSAVQTVELPPDARLQVGSAVLKVDFKDVAELKHDKELYEAATLDALTRVSNRRSLSERAQSEIALTHRTSRWLHCILLDVDHFKKVNDTWGHPAGDFVLREVAEVLRNAKREEDLLGRWGGEEFVLLFRDVEPAQAQAFAERLRNAVEQLRIRWEDQKIPVTISLGLVSRQGKQVPTLDTMVSQADAALYRAKQNGRNRVEIVA